MLFNLSETAALISTGRPLQIAGSADLLARLPRGMWIGGSTEYFMTEEGGAVCGNRLFVTELPFNCTVRQYHCGNIGNVAADAYDNGFSIVILPFDSAVHKEYAQSAAGYPDMFMKNIAGWVSGVNLDKPGQTPVTVNGLTGCVSPDMAAAMHLEVPRSKTAGISIINIFEPDEGSPAIEFPEDGFTVRECLVNGKPAVLADYLKESGADTRFPLVGDYSGSGINVSFKSFGADGSVSFYAPVFAGIRYRMAKSICDYAGGFNERIDRLRNANAVFSCNCILNFLYGELEDKKLDAFTGPVTFGEIAYQLVNQTLVYVTVED